MRVLVCGGRDFQDRTLLDAALDSIADDVEVLLHGAAPGADRLADLWAERHGKPVLPFPAEWHTHDKAAGPIRNQRMIDEGKPDLVVAFPGGRGTADMKARAGRAGIWVRVIEAQLNSKPEQAKP